MLWASKPTNGKIVLNLGRKCHVCQENHFIKESRDLIKGSCFEKVGGKTLVEVDIHLKWKKVIIIWELRD